MAFLESTEKMYRQYRVVKQKHPSLRFGQYFCNLYVKRFDERTDPLFNQPSDEIARIKIDEWLQDHSYLDRLPPRERIPSFADDIPRG
jgi:hypothetical protein